MEIPLTLNSPFGNCVAIRGKTDSLKKGEVVGWKRLRAVTFSHSDSSVPRL
jgi:hypothetical protein